MTMKSAMSAAIRYAGWIGMTMLLDGMRIAAQPQGSGGLQAPQFSAEDMLGVRTFATGQAISLSPSGKWIAYVETDVADENNINELRQTGHVNIRAIGRATPEPPRPITGGATHSAFPVWSPDGRRLALVRETSTGGRLALWNAETNRTEPLGEPLAARSYLAPVWTRSGTHIVYAIPAPRSPAPALPRVRVVESSDARVPGDQFFLDDRRAALAIVEVASGKSTRILSEPILLRSFQVSPKGDHLIYAVPSPDTFGVIGKEQNETFIVSTAGGPHRKVLPDEPRVKVSWSPDGQSLLYSKAGKLFAVPPEGGPPQPYLPNISAPVGEPVWSPDGARFVALVPDPSVHDPELGPAPEGMFTTARPFMDLHLFSASDGAGRNLTSAFEDQVSDPVWSPDGQAVFFRAVNNQTYDQTIYRYTLQDQQLTALTRGPESYGHLTAGPGLLAVTVEDATHPQDLIVLEGPGRRARVTDLNPQLAPFRFGKPDLFYYDNADGERLGALLYKPAGHDGGQRLPVITWIYEKLTPEAHHFNPRTQILLAHGYAVLMPNVKFRVGETADSFTRCVVPAVNAVRAMGVTTGKFGLWGHSMGAYAASNLITQTNIFAAAVSAATPPDLFRNWASGRDRDSRNIETGQARMGGSPYQYPERYWTQSAFFRLDKVTTPVLILHGEKDLTILYGEGEQMFYALRQLGKTATFVTYTNGDHSMTQHSRADTLDMYRRVLEWFDKYLK
jgi:dipeptidyl aminopeptidase/acylaminoacyl peptidase